MRQDMGIAISVLTLAALSPVGECFVNGRVYNDCEFPYTVLVKKIEKTNKTPVCMGVIYNATVVITSVRCVQKKIDSSTTIVETEHPESKQYSVKLVYKGHETKIADLNYAVVVLKEPGIPLVDAPCNASHSNGLYAPKWAQPEILALHLRENKVGVMLGLMIKVGATKVASESSCEVHLKSFKEFKSVEEIVVTGGLYCVYPATTNYFFTSDHGYAVCPGFPEDTDIGAPFIINGVVFGVLVKSWPRANQPLALFCVMERHPDETLNYKGYNLTRADKKVSKAHPIFSLSSIFPFLTISASIPLYVSVF